MSVTLSSWNSGSVLYVEVIGAINTIEEYREYIVKLHSVAAEYSGTDIILDKRNCMITSNLSTHTESAEQEASKIPAELSQRVTLHEVVLDSRIPMERLWVDHLKKNYGITVTINGSLVELLRKFH